MDYPNLTAWQARLADNYGGIFGLFALTCIGCFYALWLRRRYPIATRLLAGVGYWIALVVAAPAKLAILPLVGVFAGFGWMYRHIWQRVKPLALILLIGFMVRLPGLWAESLWYDETFTANVARLSPADMWTVIQSDVHPPLWYGIEWLTIRALGDSEAALRLPAMLFGIVSIWLIYHIAARVTRDASAAKIAALLLALMPAFINYSNEARGYALLTCSVLAMIYAIYEDKPRLFAIAGLATLYTHNIGYTYVAVLFGLSVYLSQITPNMRRRWYPAHGAVLVGALLWLPMLLNQSKDVSNGFWMQSIQLGEIVAPVLHMTFYATIPPEYMALIAVVAFTMTVLTVINAKNFVVGHVGLVWVMVVFFVPGGVALLSYIWRNVYLDRALLPSVALLLIGWAWLLTMLPKGDRRALLMLFVPALFISVVGYLNPTTGKFNIREGLPGACGGRPVFVTTIPAAMMAAYYLDDVTVWTDASDLNQWLSQDAKSALFTLGDFANMRAGEVCVIEGESALNKASERQYMTHLLTLPHTTRTIAQNTIYGLKAHIVKVQ